MARINLLPWREERRKQQQKEFFTLIGVAAGFTVLVMTGVHLHIGGLIDYQHSRNSFLENEISSLEKKIKEINELEEKKARLISKMEVIQQLQVSRPEIVHLFDEVAKTIPEGVYISKLEQKGKKVTFEGLAQSNARVSTYMRNIEASLWLADPDLNIIQSGGQKDQSKLNRFTLNVNQQSKNSEKRDGEV